MTIENQEIVLLISSDTEWKCVKNIYSEEDLKKYPFGEMFSAKLGKPNVLFLHSGWGKVTAAATAQYAIDHFHPKLLINLGTCGGFRGIAEVGEVILVKQTIIYDIIEQMSDPREAIDFYCTTIDLSWLSSAHFQGTIRDIMLSADRDIVISQVPELMQKFSARVADWESGAIAWVAARNKQRILILRGISDLVGEDGGEVYANMDRYENRTKVVMEKLIGLVNVFLNDPEIINKLSRGF